MSKLKKIGAFWLKTSKSGVNYMSGTIEDATGNKTNIIVFKNTKKEKENQPDYTISVDIEKYPLFQSQKVENNNEIQVEDFI